MSIVSVTPLCDVMKGSPRGQYVIATWKILMCNILTDAASMYAQNSKGWVLGVSP